MNPGQEGKDNLCGRSAKGRACCCHGCDVNVVTIMAGAVKEHRLAVEAKVLVVCSIVGNHGGWRNDTFRHFPA